MEEDFLSSQCLFLVGTGGGGGSFGQVSDVSEHLSSISYRTERDVSIDGNNLLVKVEKIKQMQVIVIKDESRVELIERQMS